jgi:hypothetical protein
MADENDRSRWTTEAEGVAPLTLEGTEDRTTPENHVKAEENALTIAKARHERVALEAE